MHPGEVVAVVVISGVAAVSLTLAGLGIRARTLTGNRALAWVAVAFLLFFAKSFVTAGALLFHAVAHEHLELLGSLFDFAIVGCLAAPFLRRP